jgi:hypothetical protein
MLHILGIGMSIAHCPPLPGAYAPSFMGPAFVDMGRDGGGGTGINEDGPVSRDSQRPPEVHDGSRAHQQWVDRVMRHGHSAHFVLAPRPCDCLAILTQIMSGSRGGILEYKGYGITGSNNKARGSVGERGSPARGEWCVRHHDTLSYTKVHLSSTHIHYYYYCTQVRSYTLFYIVVHSCTLFYIVVHSCT